MTGNLPLKAPTDPALLEVYAKILVGRVVGFDLPRRQDDSVLIVTRVDPRGMAYGISLNASSDGEVELSMDHAHRIAEQTHGWTILV